MAALPVINDYKRPFRLGDTVHAELWVSALRNTSATLDDATIRTAPSWR